MSPFQQWEASQRAATHAALCKLLTSFVPSYHDGVSASEQDDELPPTLRAGQRDSGYAVNPKTVVIV